MKQWWERVTAQPVVAHILRATGRFGDRLGNQFAAAIAYFSVVSLVPIIMVCFSGLGLALTVFYPDALASVEAQIQAAFGGTGENTGKQIVDIMTGALRNWAAIGGIGLASALWVGSSWIGNLKNAIRLQLRPELGQPQPKLPLPLDVAQNLGILVVLLVGVLVTFAVVPFTTLLSGEAIATMGLPSWLGSGVMKVVGMVVSLIVGTALFWVLYRLCSAERPPARALLAGSFVGSVGLAVLQVAMTYLLSAFSKNAAAAVFGSVIVLMLFLNLFATLILMVAAWTGTWEVPPVPAAQPEAAAEEDTLVEVPEEYVRQEVAEVAMKAGLGAGYVVGAASGLGLGALLAVALRRRGRARIG